MPADGFAEVVASPPGLRAAPPGDRGPAVRCSGWGASFDWGAWSITARRILRRATASRAARRCAHSGGRAARAGTTAPSTLRRDASEPGPTREGPRPALPAGGPAATGARRRDPARAAVAVAVERRRRPRAAGGRAAAHRRRHDRHGPGELLRPDRAQVQGRHRPRVRRQLRLDRPRRRVLLRRDAPHRVGLAVRAARDARPARVPTRTASRTGAATSTSATTRGSRRARSSCPGSRSARARSSRRARS